MRASGMPLGAGSIVLALSCAAAVVPAPGAAPQARSAATRRAAAPAPAPAPAPPAAADDADEDGAGAHHQHGYHLDFSEVERFARHFDSAERDAWQRPADVIEALKLSRGQVVADIGAGTGYFLPYLSEAVGPDGAVLALDVEPNMVRYVERRISQNGWSNVRARAVAADDPGLVLASVDRILIVNTWHHIDHRSRYAARLAQALRPGGAIFIVDFTEDSDLGPPKSHRLSASAVVRELARAGLQAEILTAETLPKQYVVRAWSR